MVSLPHPIILVCFYIKGSKNLARWTLLSHSSYGIELPLSTIHPHKHLHQIWFGSNRWIFSLNICFSPFSWDCFDSQNPLPKIKWYYSSFCERLCIRSKPQTFLDDWFKLIFSCMPCLSLVFFLIWYLNIYNVHYYFHQCFFTSGFPWLFQLCL